MKYEIKQDETGQKYVEVDLRGYDLINNPLLNKGRSFTVEERAAFKLRGLVPPAYLPLEEIVDKNYQTVVNSPDDLERHIFLRNLQDRNETLFYALMNKYIEQIMPIVYTPTVGKACQLFGRIYRRQRGIFISYPNRKYIDEILDHANFDDVEVIVVSDGERILGLGDQGSGGMGIPIGKLSLYTGCAGIAPGKTLPIILDVGTNNQKLLDDPLYLGWRHRRVTGQEYDDFVDEFVQAVKKRFPNVLLQWEDFAQNNALKLLNRYKDQLCTFNDDIQGTASIVVGALLSAANASGLPLTAQRIVVVGAGSAGVGISNLIVSALVDAGVNREVAYKSFYLVDRNGLITDNVTSLDFQQPFSRNASDVESWDVADKNNITLLETVVHAKATMMIGVCAQGGIFTRDVIKALANNCERPIVFPLSNPTEKAEANPHDVLDWTEGRAIVGTGTAFPLYDTGTELRRIDQVNNSYIFPGLGLGVLVVKSRRVTDQMFLVAAKALAELSPARENPNANLLPPLKEVRQVSRKIAFAVAKEAVRAGLTEYSELSDSQLEQLLDEYIWEPVYLPYRPKSI
ncbi:MAG: NAD-dependent malic enzyme [Proteobacteria bacterium]|nr:MAG: NAD-dependent malic enzyme [Pseudomonadota bacterium]